MTNLLSIIIPVYNEEKRIDHCLQAVFQADSLGMKKEIIIVDDGSEDKTVMNVKTQISNFQSRSKNQNSNVKITLINKPKNEGKGSAVKDGLLRSTGEIVLIQDADLEYSPSDYPTLLEPFLKNQADAVFGSRFISNRPHRVLYFWHYLVNVFLTTLSNIFTNLNLTDMETGYKVFKGDLIRPIAAKLECRRFGFEPEVTARLAKVPKVKIFEVGVSYSGRTYEEGKKISWIDGLRAIFEIIKYNLFV
jgi:glycosyltransferase involved in cell wall biosynthesis